jgi:hypothetical protein
MNTWEELWAYAKEIDEQYSSGLITLDEATARLMEAIADFRVAQREP